MSFLPVQFEPYAWIIVLIVLFVDGAIFGLAIKKGFVSIILIIVGLLLASYIGLNIPFLNLQAILNAIAGFITVEINRVGPIFFSFPILWMVGFLIGIWKG